MQYNNTISHVYKDQSLPIQTHVCYHTGWQTPSFRWLPLHRHYGQEKTRRADGRHTDACHVSLNFIQSKHFIIGPKKWKWLQRLRVCTALTEDLSSVPSIHVEQLINNYNSSSKEFDIFFWTLNVPALMTTHSHIDTHIHFIKIIQIIFNPTFNLAFFWLVLKLFSSGKSRIKLYLNEGP